jgi:RNA polymerase sigma-70 factor (ECF subfamily)
VSTPPGLAAEHDERSLIARIRAGERELFHELIRPYERALYAMAYSVLHNPADAEEVAQEAVLKAFANLGQLRADNKFKGWLLQIAFNEARLRRRKNRGHLYESLDEAGQDDDEGEFMPRQFADWRDIPSETLEKAEVRRAVDKSLLALSGKYREVFVLRDIEHLSAEETARMLGISVPAVKTRLHRARLQMRELLTPVFRKRWTDRLAFRKGRNPW